MSINYIVHVKANIQRVGSGPQIGQTQSIMNYVSLYGPLQLAGPNKRAAVENMIRELRRMASNGGLKGQQMSVPEDYEDLQKFYIPEAIVHQEVSDYIDWQSIENSKNDEE